MRWSCGMPIFLTASDSVGVLPSWKEVGVVATLRRLGTRTNAGSAEPIGWKIPCRWKRLPPTLTPWWQEIAERDLRTETGEAGGNPEAGWRRGAQAWHPDRAGPLRPASGDAGLA